MRDAGRVRTENTPANEPVFEPVGQTLRRRKLGKELKRHRDAAGLTVREVARLAGFQQGTISKIENGRQTILPRTAKLILQACDVGAPDMDTLLRFAAESDDSGWWLTFSDTMPDWFGTYVDLESDARTIWTYTSELVDGLLQTPEYAEAITRATFPGVSAEELRSAVELRQARQAQLDRSNPPQLSVVLNEAVLRRPVGGPEVMRAQCERLVQLAKRPNITVRVLPFEAGAHPGMKTPFTLLGFPEGFADLDCVYLENANGSVWQERPADIAHYTDVHERLQNLALSQRKSVALLASLD
ncbi:XRE family transcriptional regulator [Amycolatopsis antarctica]|uniref:XRE family transcriptional regulator n=2 Tax=Amycolatopsis antarctica TaxID=1854586 RepID=A0A263DCG8_9PSEU|nr:XRE family transcriptional regulator [Amycolatopsis antarctica]